MKNFSSFSLIAAICIGYWSQLAAALDSISIVDFLVQEGVVLLDSDGNLVVPAPFYEEFEILVENSGLSDEELFEKLNAQIEAGNILKWDGFHSEVLQLSFGGGGIGSIIR